MVPAFSFARRLLPCALVLLLPLAAPVRADNDAAHALAEKFSGADTAKSNAEAAARRKAEEAEMLARARQEAAAAGEAEKRLAAEAERRQQELEKEREAEAQRLAEKLKRAEDARRAKAEAEAAQSKPLSPPMALGNSRPPAAPQLDERVTILLVMEPGNKGIRRFNKTADPVLCQGANCFVSTGTATPARSLTLGKALGPGNTFGQRAGACRQKLACVFRSVPLDGHPSTIQPVDLKVLVHDRRTPRTVTGDVSCRIVSGTLTCGRTVVAPGYRAWIVPESIAEHAGPAALEAALSKGLVSAPLREAALRN